MKEVILVTDKIQFLGGRNMGFTTIIMFFTSILFLAMGTTLLFSKSFKNLSEEKKTYVKLNSIIYIFIALSSLVIAIFNYITDTKVTIYIFVCLIFIASIIQYLLSKESNR